jgi:hypothetical protein
VDLDTCPTCRQRWTFPTGPCAAIDPRHSADVVPVRCQLPAGHRSEEHWHASLWPGTPPLLWIEP